MVLVALALAVEVAMEVVVAEGQGRGGAPRACQRVRPLIMQSVLSVLSPRWKGST